MKWFDDCNLLEDDPLYLGKGGDYGRDTGWQNKVAHKLSLDEATFLGI